MQDVAEIVRRASEARNGEKFRRLYAGDLSDVGDDHSSADLALCNSLAFWCGCDAGLMDQVFRSSGLMREKWERADYRESTIAKAIESCSEVYSGSVAQVE
ncbi:MAG: DNA primase, partial [Planctomycetaceae bacterium]